ncbi:MAG: 4-amino-4-deoxychorismate lyase [Bacteroidia bacterium]|nr:MAG: 4-amino-4-deoxychorismate lyase [Bacteroidia bacterium]
MPEKIPRILYNGEYSPENKCKAEVINRAFLYGDSLFETMLADKGKIFFFENHMERLETGFSCLRYRTEDIDIQYFKERLKRELEMLLRSNRIYGKCKIRLSVFRKDGGTYTPTSNFVNYLATVTPLPGKVFSLNKKGIYLSIYKEFTKSYNLLSGLKTGNSLVYVLAGLFSKSQNTDDCLLLNAHGNIVEATASNIFYVKENTIYTPALSEGCVAGTMRRCLMQIITSETSYALKEVAVKEEDILNCEEIFLTNAISGIRWVVGYKNKRYFKNVSEILAQKLQETAAS